MKKTFKFYSICWLISFALFNVITFVTPNEMGGMSKFGGAFWVGYIFITIAFIGQLACAFFALRPNSLQKVFYNIPLISISYSGLVIMLVAGTACMTIPNLPNWIGIIVCFAILAFNAIAVIKAAFAADVVSEIDNKIKTQTQFIKLITADAEHLLSTCKSTELKAEAKKVYEAIRYSDPISNDALADIEGQIQGEFKSFVQAINSEDLELSMSVGGGLLNLIDSRNKKCKNLK